MNVEFDPELAIRLLLSFLIGTVIGIEREYRGKAAGLRTMIMICLGSTIFTEISLSIGGASPDRVASNVITGIGFLGAGVIFKDGLNVNGITTATTIWICAALGMAVGAGEYFIALVGSVVVLIVLTAFEHVKDLINRLHQVRVYKIDCHKNNEISAKIEDEILSSGLKFEKHRDIQNANMRQLTYEITGRLKTFEQLNQYLRDHAEVYAYEY